MFVLMFEYVCMHVDMSIYVCMRIYLCMYTYGYVCMICMFVQKYIYLDALFN